MSLSFPPPPVLTAEERRAVIERHNRMVRPVASERPWPPEGEEREEIERMTEVLP